MRALWADNSWRWLIYATALFVFAGIAWPTAESGPAQTVIATLLALLGGYFAIRVNILWAMALSQRQERREHPDPDVAALLRNEIDLAEYARRKGMRTREDA